MKKSFAVAASVVLILMTVTSCVTPSFEWVPTKIAILPFTNESADVSVDKFARAYLYERISSLNRHEVLSLDVVDAALEEMGITEGGQLPTATVQEICEKTGADGIIYGDVLVAKRVMLGLYFNKEFECHYTMYRGNDGVVFWDETKNDSEKKIVLDPDEMLKTAASAMVNEIATDTLLKAFKSHPLYKQIESVTNSAIWTLPR